MKNKSSLLAIFLVVGMLAIVLVPPIFSQQYEDGTFGNLEVVTSLTAPGVSSGADPGHTHSLYFAKDGSVTATGNFALGGFNISNAGTVDGSVGAFSSLDKSVGSANSIIAGTSADSDWLVAPYRAKIGFGADATVGSNPLDLKGALALWSSNGTQVLDIAPSGSNDGVYVRPFNGWLRFRGGTGATATQTYNFWIAGNQQWALTNNLLENIILVQGINDGGYGYTTTWKGKVDFTTGLYSEKVANGGFTSGSTSWSFDDAAWSWNATGGGSMLKDADGTGTLTQNCSEAVGEQYTLTYTISSVSGSGGVTASCGGVPLTNRTIAGTYTETFWAASTADLTFTPGNTSRFTLDTVTLRKVTGGGVVTDSNECIATDIIRHTISTGTPGDLENEYIEEVWTKCPASKLVSFTASYYDSIMGVFTPMSLSGCNYDGNMGSFHVVKGVETWAAGDVIVIEIKYEKQI